MPSVPTIAADLWSAPISAPETVPIRGQGFVFTLAPPPGAQATMELASSDPAGGLVGMLVTHEENTCDVTVGTRIQGESDLTGSRVPGVLPWLVLTARATAW